MNDTLQTSPAVAVFVAQVRARLTDLTEEEREELLGGLEADLAERLAEGEADLGDPVAYAAELRAAAGLEARPRRWAVRRPAVPRRPMVEQVTELLDGVRADWERWVARDPRVADGWQVAQTLRPAWWVLRAWVAVQLLDLVTGPVEKPTLLPALGSQLVSVVLLLAAVVASTLLGLGRLWPGGIARRPRLARLLLLGLNALALVVLMVTVRSFPDAWQSHELANGGYYAHARTDHGPGLMADGRYVRNVFAYDAQGNPLTGVQLYDQKGRPLAVNPDPYYGTYRSDGSRVHTYPWFNGDQKLFNVYPLPVRGQRGFQPARDPWGTARPPVLPSAPLAVVPPVSLPTPAESTTVPEPTPGDAAPASPSATPSVTPSVTPSRTASTGPSASPSADSEKPRSR
jgi:hypothetical protein